MVAAILMLNNISILKQSLHFARSQTKFRSSKI